MRNHGPIRVNWPFRRLRRLRVTALTAIVSLGICGVAAHAAPQGTEQVPVVGPPRPGSELDPDLAWYRAILQNSTNEAEVRQGAAQRITSRGSADAFRILEEALRSGDAGQIEAVASALDEDSRKRVPLLEPLLAALQSSPKSLHPKLTRLLAREGDAACDRVASMAMDSSLTPAERLGAIYAMGQLHGRDPAPDLMQLLDEKRRESADVVREVCDSLGRCTGQRFEGNADAWRQWWAARRSQPTQQITVSTLQEQLMQLQKQLDAESERSQKLAAKLSQSYTDLFLALPAAERAERLTALLEDELPELRGLALAQIDRMLRNGERPPETLVQRVLVRLKDKSPPLRVRAMRLLDDLAVPQLSERLAEILPTESDPTVADAMLRVLAQRPVPQGFGPISARLTEPNLSESAAAALNRMVDSSPPSAGWEARVVDAARAAVSAKPTPEMARLLAVAGNETDRDAVAQLLNSRDDALRAGAAEGLRRAGRRRPLVDRAAADPIVYPIAVASLADQPASTAVVSSLIELPPRSEQAAAWNAAMGRTLQALSAKDLLAADDRLAKLQFAEPRTRSDALQAVLVDPAVKADASLRGEILARLADLLIDQGDARAAVAVLGAVKPEAGSPLRARLFRAAVIDGDYDVAAGVEAAPAPWIALLGELARKDPAAARPVADEIVLRFAGRLSPDERARLDAIDRTLGQDAGNGG